MLHPRIFGGAVLGVIMTSAIGAFPGTVASAATTMHFGRSIGSPTAGHLVGGAHLAPTAYLRVVPVYEGNNAQWGLGPLVGMLDRAARQVHRQQQPEAMLSIGHLSRQNGGEIDRHASHESGRDADVAFYVKNQAGRPIYADHFVPFRADGTAPTWPGAVFDDARNWAFVAAALEDPVARVSHVFVAAPIRSRLLAYAKRMGVSAELRTRAAEVMVQPRGSLPHDDHFHVRIACPSGMRECIENPTPRRAPRYAHVSSPHGRERGSEKRLQAPGSRLQVEKQPPPSRAPRAVASTDADAPAGVLAAPLDIDDADGDL